MLLDLGWAVALALAILAVVGGPLSWAVGLRGLWAVAAAPAFAITVIAGTAVVAPLVGVSWSLLPVLVMTALVCAVLLVIRRVTAVNLSIGPRRRADGWLIGALAGTVLLVGYRVVQIIGEPGNISQTFDNIFHLNATRFILDVGNASSLHIGYMTNPDGTLPFYPAAWHALAALVVQSSGATIPVAVYAVVLVTGAVMWPLGAFVLVRTLFGRAAVVSVGAGLLATSIPAYPLLPMDYGVLYPFQLGLALLPVALAATARALSVARRSAPVWWWMLVLLGVLPGMTLSHPGAFVAWLALSAPFVVIFIVDRWRAARTGLGRLVIVLGAIGYLAVGAVLVRVLRPSPEARLWPTSMSMFEAIGQTLSVSMWYQIPAVGAACAIIAGVIWALVDRTRPALAALGAYVVAAALYVIVASLPFLGIRDAFTGSWYNNLPRLAAILAIAMVPIGAYGVARSWTAVRGIRRIRAAERTLSRVARWAGAVALVIVLAIAFQGASLPRAVAWAEVWYRFGPSSPLLTSDEYELLQRVPDHVPEGVAIAGSAWTGASLAYAIADRPVLMPHTLMSPNADIVTVNDELDTARAGDATCAAVDALDVGFVLDFGGAEIQSGWHSYAGLDGLADSEVVHLVDSEGDARLYAIVGCG